MSGKKIAVLLGDGMADLPLPELGNRTPLEAARTPNMDRLAARGVMGMVRTVPPGLSPGSDTANLSVFGYNPAENYTGRAPLEALNMGLDMGPADVAFRCNLVTLADGVMEDFSAHHIETDFAAEVIAEFKRGIIRKGIEFHPGVSYRHIMMWRDFPHAECPVTTPPHDIQGRKASEYLPGGPGADLLRDVMDESAKIIKGSAAIAREMKNRQGRPVSAWLWGAGKKPALRPLRERFGLEGHTISAVDLIHGIGRAAGLSPIRVPGATGYLDTDYSGKAEALLEAMRSVNFVFLHVESPDESGHEGNLEHKIKAIEDFDAKVVGRVMEGMSGYGDHAILVMPDHPTPIAVRTHTADPVPFCIYSTRGFNGLRGNAGSGGYSERAAAATGLYVEEGHRLIEIILHERI